MAICKYVWVCESDPSKYFENSKDAERFDRKAEVETWVNEETNTEYPHISSVIERIMERYEITQRYDYKAPEGEQE